MKHRGNCSLSLHMTSSIKFRYLLLLGFFYAIAFSVSGQSNDNFQKTFYFSPNYTLPGNAGVTVGNQIMPPESRFDQFKIKKSIPDFRGEVPSDIVHQLLDQDIELPFTLEFSFLHHVNQPLVFSAFLTENETPVAALTYTSQSDRAPSDFEVFSLNDQKTVATTSKDVYQAYWHHYVIHLDKQEVAIYHNGKLELREPFAVQQERFNIDLVAYLSKEPYMQMGNLLKQLTVSEGKLAQEDVVGLYEAFQNEIKRGWKYPELFHFNAGPYLHLSTSNSVNILWETNKPANAVVEYGMQLPLTNQVKVSGLQKKVGPDELPTFIYEATIEGLQCAQPYFYNVKLNSYDGESMESGVLTFKTAVEGHTPFMFALIGDTETRPHINDRISKLIWKERPDFLINLGDLTDGGMKDAKWQWNLEYFEGMGALHHRIPVFPVPGNGEGDLYWYKKYHRLPGNEAYYHFHYGNADFYMLNSNGRKDEFKPGGKQYQWLDSALATSTGDWKFVAMHHAPYSADENDYGDTYKGSSNLGDPHVQKLVPLFEKHKVDAVLFGHLHSYNRIGPISGNHYDELDGVRYIQAGGAGGNLEDFAPSKVWFSQKTYSGHHYCIVNINHKEMILKTYNLDGALIDYMRGEK